MRHTISKIFSVLFVVSFLISLYSCGYEANKVNIFYNIQECQKIKTKENDSISVEVMNEPMEDKHLRDLEYTEFFGCKYVTNELSFDLFAYVFQNDEDAQSYYTNVTGKTHDPATTYSDVAGMTSFRRVVISGTKAYMVSTKREDADEVKSILNDTFSVQLF